MHDGLQAGACTMIFSSYTAFQYYCPNTSNEPPQPSLPSPFPAEGPLSVVSPTDWVCYSSIQTAYVNTPCTYSNIFRDATGTCAGARAGYVYF